MSGNDDPDFSYTRIPSAPVRKESGPLHELVIEHPNRLMVRPVPPLAAEAHPQAARQDEAQHSAARPPAIETRPARRDAQAGPVPDAMQRRGMELIMSAMTPEERSSLLRISERYGTYHGRQRAEAANPGGDGISPDDPVFGSGVNLDDTAPDAYGQPYRIAGAPVAGARSRVASDGKTAVGPGTHDKTAKPRARKRPPAETPGFDRHDITPVPLVDDEGHAVLTNDHKPIMRPAGMDPHFFVAEGLKIREREMSPLPGLGSDIPATVLEIYELFLFRIGGLWDAQRISGKYNKQFRDYATVAIGLYAAAAGMSEIEILEIENIVAATESHFAKTDTKDTTYTQLPVRNVNNTMTGYRLYQSGLITAKAPKP